MEAAALATLDGAARPFSDVFRAATRDERMRGHGMSDLQFAAYLRALAEPTPLVTLTDATIAITADRRAVRDGARDRLDAQPLDWWLGGVRLEGRRAAWRRDERTERLT